MFREQIYAHELLSSDYRMKLHSCFVASDFTRRTSRAEDIIRAVNSLSIAGNKKNWNAGGFPFDISLASYLICLANHVAVQPSA
jgi:hypothetical protein